MTKMTLHMGPQHPMLHGLWSFKIDIDGEKIYNADVRLGYIHKGVEKIAETRTYDGFIPLADRGICYASAFTWGSLYTGTIERLFGIEDDVPDRANWIRTMLSEAQRIASHMFWLSAWVADLGNWTGMMLGFRDREFFVDLLEQVTGARLNYNFNRIGGVARDIPDGFEKRAEEACNFLDDYSFAQWEDLLDKSDVFVLRTKDVGIMPPDQAIRWGYTGANLRACGLPVDVRKLDPYFKYNEVDFDIPTGVQGDSLDRYKVRMEEMKQSVKIIRQCLQKMEPGPVMYEGKLPRKPPFDEAFFRIDDPRGESAMYVINDPERNKDHGLMANGHPYRLKIKSPAFVHMSSFPKLVTGGKVADIVSILGSIDLCTGETDR
ncbi:MAG: NADH-quinone oxidoreductase subunit D [Candidatus Thorarchaeota archaeon]